MSTSVAAVVPLLRRMAPASPTAPVRRPSVATAQFGLRYGSERATEEVPVAAPERKKPSVVVVDGGVEVALWRADHLDRPTLAVVQALARLQLDAKRLGCEIRVRDACAELRGLLDLCGLADTVLEPDERTSTSPTVRPAVDG
jgi:hypothetical protein